MCLFAFGLLRLSIVVVLYILACSPGAIEILLVESALVLAQLE